MVKIGDYWGKKYDYITNLPKYIRFRLTTGVKLKDWRKCMEAIEDPRMYLKEGFIPSKNDVILDIGAQYGDYAMIWSKKYGCMGPFVRNSSGEFLEPDPEYSKQQEQGKSIQYCFRKRREN